MLQLRLPRKSNGTSGFAIMFMLLIVSVATLHPRVVQASEEAIRGDTKADGIVDGRDALQIMRIVEGLDASTEEFIQRGDVYPIPGVAGREVGDGALTRDDAERILQYAVGLASEGELSADFSRSTPRIDDFEPLSGPIGTPVAIHGANFVPSAAGDNMVLFGEVEAPILEVAPTRILTQVPEGASTSRIRVRTVGGAAISNGEFVVTAEKDGVLELDGGLNPADFVLTSGYAETDAVQGDGGFRLLLPEKGLALVGAVPKSEGNNSYLTVYLPTDPHGITPGQSSPLRIDARTTAKALVFMHPFFLAKNPAIVRSLLNLMDSVPEVETLAQTIAERYPQGADGLNDPAVGEAWDRAVVAVMNALPSSSVITLSRDVPASAVSGAKGRKVSPPDLPISSRLLPSFAVPGNTRGDSRKQLADTPDPRVMVWGIDRHFMRADYIEEEHALEPKLEPYESPFPWAATGYSPVDWWVVLYGLDTGDMPLGINEPWETLARRRIAVTDFNVATVVAANQWTAKIDIVYTAVDSVISPVYGAIFGGNTLRLPDSPEGVYMLRCFSGSLYAPNVSDRYEFTVIKNIPDGQDCANYSTVVNLAMVVVDAWDLATGESKRWARAALKKAVQNGVRKLSQEMSNVQISELSGMHVMGILVRTLVECGKGASTAVPQGVVTWAQGRMLSQFEAALTRANSLLTALDKISSAGRIGERLIGLAGYMVNALDMEITTGPTPLESILVVVGEPFSALVYRIDPTEGGTDTVITLTGERFKAKPADNQVYFQSGGITHEAKVLAVRNGNSMDVRVPNDLQYNTPYYVNVETVASRGGTAAPQQFVFKRIPRLTSVTPLEGFALVPRTAEHPLAGSSFPGTTIRLIGSSFNPLYNTDDVVYFGSESVSMLHRTNTEIQITVPQLSPGFYDIYIKSPENENYETRHFSFKILEPPTLREVEPESAKLGDVVILRGDNFGSFGYRDSPLRIQIGDELVEPLYVFRSLLRFRMPGVGEPDEALPISVWTPSGRSSTKEITRIPGIGETRTIEFDPGWRITVNSYAAGVVPDGKMSLEEATSIGRGELDPFAPPWDDKNVHIYQHWQQWVDHNNTRQWREGVKETVEGDSGPGPEYEHQYDVRRYLDGQTIESLTKQKSLDATPEDMEEGDYVSGSKYGGGDRRADKIIAQAAEKTYEVLWLELGNDDDVILPGNSTIDAIYSIELSYGSILQAGTITTRREIPIIINGDDNEVTATIVGSVADGIVINQGVRNTFRVEIDSCKGNGILLRGGGGNRIDSSTIGNCGGDGIRIESGERNEIQYCEIRDCDGSGIVLDHSHNNLILRTICEANARYGIHLVGSDNNQIRYSSVYDNNKEGLFVAGSQQNLIEQVNSHGNLSGIVLSGTGCVGNEIRICKTVEDDASDVRRQLYGIRVKNGANGSLIDRCYISGTASHGILIEGPETNGNFIQFCRLGWGGRIVDRIGGDGIRIQNAAELNQVVETSIMGCDGNGITVTGAGTDFNVIADCELGRVTRYTGPADDVYVNGGWGVRIEDQAFLTTVRYCTFGVNRLGGISVQDTGPQAGDPNHPFILEKNSIGYHGRVVQKPEDGGSISSRQLRVDRTSGDGISLNNAHAGNLFDNRIYGHVTGISLQDTSENFIEQQEVLASGGNGMLAERARDDLIRWSLFSRAALSGVQLRNSEGLQFIYGSVQSATKEGMFMWSCKDIVIEGMQFGPANGRRGLAIFDSQNITVQSCNSWENHADGYLVENSRNIVFDRSHADENKMNGYLLMNCSDVKLFGERPREGLWVFNNEQSGIVVQDCKRIDLGYDGKGVNVSGYTEEGILITGDETEHVKITSSIVPNNGKIEGKFGIRVESGKNITIGGPRPEERNNVEFGNEIGILIQGENTDVAIINNLVGEPEEWETGTRKNGNVIGIKIAGAAHNVAITGNIINANQESGIVLSEGANQNLIYGNQITENGEHGVVVEGANAVRNFISRNSISRNVLKGIQLIDGGNREIEPPVITEVNWGEYNITGTSDNVPEGSMIEVYGDDDDEGLVLVGRSPLFGNSFYVSGYVPKDKTLHAIVVDPEGNTSEFGPSKLRKRDEEVGSFAFASGPDGGRDIYVIGPGMEVPVRITNNPADDYDPRFSEDGDHLLFVSTRSGNPDLWMMSKDGAEAAQVTDDAAADYDPDRLAETDRFVFVSERHGNPEIYMRSISEEPGEAGGEISYFGEWFGAYQFGRPGDAFAVHFTSAPGMLQNVSFYIADRLGEFNWKVLVFDNGPTDTVLAEGTATPTAMGWHTVDLGAVPVPSDFLVCLYFLGPDLGPGVAVGSTPPGVSDRWWTYNSSTATWSQHGYRPFMFKAYVEAGSSGPVRLTNNNAVDRCPSWSPDGSKIAFASDRDENMDIWLMNADGSDPVRATDGGGGNTKPAWSSDGTKIAFVSDRDGNEEIYLLDVLSKSVLRLTDHPTTDTDPVWERGGTRILFSSNRDSGFEIYAVGAGGGAPRRLTFTLRDSVQPDAGPASLPDWLKLEPVAPVVPQPEPPTTLAEVDLSVESAQVKPGDTFTLNLRLAGAKDVGNLALDLEYDPTGLRLIDISHGTFSQDVLSAINPEFYPSDVQPIRTNWVRAAGLTGDFQLLAIVFKALEEADAGDYPIEFRNVVAYDNRFNRLPTMVHDGQVTMEREEVGIDSWMLY